MAKRKSTSKKAPRRPRPRDLPGMEDRAIPELQSAGEEYADIRDQRMALNKQEVELKERVRTLMHKHGKDHYACEELEIHLVAGEESVKVKIHRSNADAEDAE